MADRRRIVIDLVRAGAETIEGTARVGGGEPVAFTGWLDLLRLLEAGAPGRDVTREEGGST